MVTALPRGDCGQVPADRVGDNAGVGHILISRSQGKAQNLSICEQAGWFKAEVCQAIPSPAIGYVAGIGGPAGQEDLAGPGELSILCYTDKHLYHGPGYYI